MIVVDAGNKVGSDLEKLVDDDIDRFEEFMLRRVDDSGKLSKPERAIIKTYIYYKTHPELGNG